jgi:hypothetical protein
MGVLIAAFGGGIFGALIGATASFVLLGFMGTFGIAITLAGGGDTFLNEVAFGPFFGPHVAFVGGVAAAAFAGKISKRRNKDNSLVTKDPANVKNVMAATDEKTKDAKSEYILNGEDTTIPLFKTSDPLILLIGGIFGLLGHLTNQLFTNWNIPIDTIALTVAVFGIITRFVFGKSGILGL